MKWRYTLPTDHLLAAASTSSSSPSCGRAQDRRSPSPNRRSQTPGPSNSECYIHKRFGPAANNCWSLHFPGKHQSRREEEKLNSLPVGGYLVYLQDDLSNRDYLVDTGASRSVFPHRSSAAPTGPCLVMADGRPTKAWGSRLIPLQFGSHRFQFQFSSPTWTNQSWVQTSWQSLTS